MAAPNPFVGSVAKVDEALTSSVQKVDEALTSFDEKHKLTENTRSTFQKMETGLEHTGEFFMKNKVIAVSVNAVSGAVGKVADLMEGKGPEPNPALAIPIKSDEAPAPTAEAPPPAAETKS